MYLTDIARKKRDFNPRSRKGSDDFDTGEPISDYISIHAPARGATIASSYPYAMAIEFQSTLPQGERHDQVGNG